MASLLPPELAPQAAILFPAFIAALRSGGEAKALLANTSVSQTVAAAAAPLGEAANSPPGQPSPSTLSPTSTHVASPASPPSRSNNLVTRINNIRAHMGEHKFHGADTNAFVKSGGVKTRKKIAAEEQRFHCSHPGCTAKRALRVYHADDRVEWIEVEGHVPHSPTTRTVADPSVKRRAIDALSLGGKPGVIAHKLLQEDEAPMTSKQLANAKAYQTRKEIGPERDILSLISKYQELTEVCVLPFRAPMLAPYATALCSKGSQYYIDTTFDLIVANIYVTPLLIALPTLDPAARNTGGPVLPIAFLLHENKATDDYKHLLGLLKKKGMQPTVMHRDFDDAIAKAISEVRFDIFFNF